MPGDPSGCWRDPVPGRTETTAQRTSVTQTFELDNSYKYNIYTVTMIPIKAYTTIGTKCFYLFRSIIVL